MSTSLQTTQQPTAKLSQLVQREDYRAQLVAAVGDTMAPEQFISHALVSFQTEEVRGCTPASQLTAMFELAALGLLPTLKQAVLIKYKNEVKVMPQWQGYKALMERHPSILEVQAVLVHVRDEFSFSDDEVRHASDPFDPKRTFNGPADIKGGYCKIIYRDGRPPKFHFVTAAHIEKCRKCAQTQNVWTKWYEQMALKTVYRDAYARRAVPVDPLVAERLERTLAADDAILGNQPIRIASQPSGNARLRNALSKPQDPADDASPQNTTPEPEAPTANADATREAATTADDQGVGAAGQCGDVPGEDDAAVADSDQRRAEYVEIAQSLKTIKDLGELKTKASADPVLREVDRVAVLGEIGAAVDEIRLSRGAGSNPPRDLLGG